MHLIQPDFIVKVVVMVLRSTMVKVMCTDLGTAWLHSWICVVFTEKKKVLQYQYTLYINDYYKLLPSLNADLEEFDILRSTDL